MTKISNILKAVVEFVKAKKISVTFKFPFINVSFAPSLFSPPIGGFLFYLPPALPNSFALYSGAMTCKR